MGPLSYRGNIAFLGLLLFAVALASLLFAGLFFPLGLWLVVDHLCRHTELETSRLELVARPADFYLECAKILLLCLITLGLYAPWGAARFRRWLFARIEHRGRALAFVGEGGDYLFVHLWGLILTIISLGLLAPWYLLEVVRWNVDHVVVGARRLELSAPVVPFLGRIWLDLVLAAITLGLYLPFAAARQLAWVFERTGSVRAAQAPTSGVRAPALAFVSILFSALFLIAARYRDRLPLEALEDELYRRARAVVVEDIPEPGGRAAGGGASASAQGTESGAQGPKDTSEAPPSDLACCSAELAEEPEVRAVVDRDGQLTITNRADP